MSTNNAGEGHELTFQILYVNIEEGLCAGHAKQHEDTILMYMERESRAKQQQLDARSRENELLVDNAQYRIKQNSTQETKCEKKSFFHSRKRTVKHIDYYSKENKALRKKRKQKTEEEIEKRKRKIHNDDKQRYIQACANKMKRACAGTGCAYEDELFTRLTSCDYNRETRTAVYTNKAVPKWTALIIGMTKEKQRVATLVYGFSMYFYVELKDTCNSTMSALDVQMRIEADLENKAHMYGKVEVEVVSKFRVSGWYPDEEDPKKTQSLELLRIRCDTPTGFKKMKRWFRYLDVPTEIHEEIIPKNTKFMAEMGLQISGWATIPNVQTFDHPMRKYSRADFFSIISCEQIRHDTSIVDDIAPMLTMAFDIECMSDKDDKFPSAKSGDEVITIGAVSSWSDSKECVSEVVFCLKETDSIESVRDPAEGDKPYRSHKVDVRCFDTCTEMIVAFCAYISIELRPNIVLTYNGDQFDWSYMIDYVRCFGTNRQLVQCLDLSLYNMCLYANLNNSSFSSKARGAREMRYPIMCGRHNVDLMQYVKEKAKLASFGLKDVSRKYLRLDNTKNDMPYREIAGVFRSGPKGRARIADYCIQDCTLTLRIMYAMLYIENQIEQSRVSHTSLLDIIYGGQQIRTLNGFYIYGFKTHVYNKLDLDKCGYNKRVGFVIDGEKYSGATVIEPVKGYYDDPVSTLDFASLYPSIMCSQNLCMSTLVINELSQHQIDCIGEENLNHIDMWEGCRFTFVKHVAGVLISYLKSVLAARAVAKKALKEAKDPDRKAIMDSRQLSLKITANSAYGFTGAAIMGKLPCVPVAASVTFFGRQLIEQTKQIVAQHYPKSRCIYGDTDSVMVIFHPSEYVPEHMCYEKMLRSEKIHYASFVASKMADILTEALPERIQMEFEKISQPYYLIGKKRYAGNMYVPCRDSSGNPIMKFSELDIKGIEAKRRDTPGYIKRLQTTILDIMFNMPDDMPVDVSSIRNRIWEYTSSVFEDITYNRLPLSDYEASSSLNLYYACRKTGKTFEVNRLIDRQAEPNPPPPGELMLPNVIAAQYIAREEKETKKVGGSRLSIVFTEGVGSTKQVDNSLRARTREYCERNNMTPDRRYYIDRTVRCCQKFLSGIDDPAVITRKMEEYIGRYINRNNKKIEFQKTDGTQSMWEHDRERHLKELSDRRKQQQQQEAEKERMKKTSSKAMTQPKTKRKRKRAPVPSHMSIKKFFKSCRSSKTAQKVQ